VEGRKRGRREDEGRREKEQENHSEQLGPWALELYIGVSAILGGGNL